MVSTLCQRLLLEAQVKLTVRVKSRAKDIGGKAQTGTKQVVAGGKWLRLGLGGGGGNEFIFLIFPLIQIAL